MDHKFLKGAQSKNSSNEYPYIITGISNLLLTIIVIDL